MSVSELAFQQYKICKKIPLYAKDTAKQPPIGLYNKTNQTLDNLKVIKFRPKIANFSTCALLKSTSVQICQYLRTW